MKRLRDVKQFLGFIEKYIFLFLFLERISFITIRSIFILP